MPIRVLVVDDSRVARELLGRCLARDGDFEVVGSAATGEEAIRAALSLRPDIITMDLNMPGMNGLQVTRKIMEEHPIPIVIVTNHSIVEKDARAFGLVEAGAVTMIEKPPGFGAPDFEQKWKELKSLLKTVARVRLAKRKQTTSITQQNVITQPQKPKLIRCIAIGASTGGPPVIKTILTKIGPYLNVPVLIVQHIASGFSTSLASWLAAESGLRVQLAENGTHIKQADVYVAPDGFHMGISRSGQITLSDGPKESSLRPSVNYLFRSLAGSFRGDLAAVLLTGMGSDGASGLKMLRDLGALTYAQDKDTCTIYGMPAEAAKLSAACEIMSPERIAESLINLMARDPLEI